MTRTTATYTIYGTNEPYSGLVVRIGDALFTTKGGAREGDSYQLIETEIIDTSINNNLPRGNQQNRQNRQNQQNQQLNSNQTNLITLQGEFINRRTGQPVPAGVLYHIHPDKGPMEGGIHNPNIPGGQAGHDFFDRTNGGNVERSLEMNTQTMTPTFSTQTPSGMDTPPAQTRGGMRSGGGSGGGGGGGY